MQKNSFSILGLEENANQAQVDEAYEVLKKKYQEDRFLEGEAGAEASKNLSKLEEAYGDCQDILKGRVVVNDFGSTMGMVEKLVKDGKYEEAQTELDRIETRDAEWHYYQAMIYFKKKWFLESKKQLQISVAIDPNNQKYQNSLKKIDEVMAQENPFEQANRQAAQQQQGGFNDATSQQQSRGGYSQPTGRGGSGASCCNGCSALCCADTCCECMGGDLCSCC